MKKQFLMSAAVGALVATNPAMAQPPAPVPTYNWTGFYGGLNVGWSWGNGAVTYNEPALQQQIFHTLPTSFSGPSELDGAVGGAQIGYNWQINNAWVAGLEADWQAASEVANGSFNFPVSNIEGLTGQLGSQILWFGTVRGRVGWLYAPDVMVYATGGLAYGKVDAAGSFSASIPTGAVPSPIRQWAFEQSAINTGWTVGGGVEGNVQNLPNVTWKVEYLYVDLGSISGCGFDTLPAAAGGVTFGGPHPFSFNAHFTDNIFRVGLNWHNF
jgi:outer membrane immunogenic protein